MRLNKFLAHAGVASRREADALIQAATTSVNGKIVTDPALDVKETDDIRFDGRRLSLPEPVIYILNKPKGVISTVSDPQHRTTVRQFIPTADRLFPVGRLDKDSTGLLLLTNDGALANRLMHPRYQMIRRYEVEINQKLTQSDISALKKGLYIGQGEFGRADVVDQEAVKKRTVVLLELRQGKKREIRRLMKGRDRTVFRLHRIQFGPVQLPPSLSEGKFKQLSRDEIRRIKAKVTEGGEGR